MLAAHSVEDPIWGLIRIIAAQQVSTLIACTIAERIAATFPTVVSPRRETCPTLAELRAFGLPERRAQACVSILERAEEISSKVEGGMSWENALQDIKGHWTQDSLDISHHGPSRAVRSSTR